MSDNNIETIRYVDLDLDEAWMVLNAFEVANTERGLVPEEENLIKRIKSYWPEIIQHDQREELSRKVWSELTEKNEDVKNR